LVLVSILSSMYVRGRSQNSREDTWQVEESTPEPTRDERIPEGWTLQEFLNWLDGPMPDGWTPEQWQQYRKGMDDLR